MQNTELNRAESIIERISGYLRGICHPEENAGFGMLIDRRDISLLQYRATELGAEYRQMQLSSGGGNYSPLTASAGWTWAALVAGYQLAARHKIKLPPTTKAISNG